MTTQIQDAQAGVNAIAERFGTPETAQMTFTVGADLRDGLRMDLDVRGHAITVDEPRALGGSDAGANPVELVLAAITTCQAITYRVWASKLGIALDRVHVEADGDIDLRGFFGTDESVRPGYSALRLRVTIEGPESDDRYAELAAAVDGHCPVLDIIGNGVPIERVIV